MSTASIQLRNVPSEFHRRLKARAALEGLSMSDYIMRELRKSLERPTRADVLERIRSTATKSLAPTAAEAIRAERDSRHSGKG